MSAKLCLTLLLLLLFSPCVDAQSDTDLTKKGTMEEQGKLMMEKAKMMMEHGKALMDEGDSLMKTGTEMMEGKVSSRGPWTEELNLEGKGKVIRNRADTIWQEGNAMVNEGLKMMDSSFMVDKGEMMIKDGVLLMKEGIALREISDAMIKEGRRLMSK